MKVIMAQPRQEFKLEFPVIQPLSLKGTSFEETTAFVKKLETAYALYRQGISQVGQKAVDLKRSILTSGLDSSELMRISDGLKHIQIPAIDAKKMPAPVSMDYPA